MGRWHATCWKSRTRRHDGLGHRHPQATRGRRAARSPAPAAGSRLLWADTKYWMPEAAKLPDASILFGSDMQREVKAFGNMKNKLKPLVKKWAAVYLNQIKDTRSRTLYVGPFAENVLPVVIYDYEGASFWEVGNIKSFEDPVALPPVLVTKIHTFDFLLAGISDANSRAAQQFLIKWQVANCVIDGMRVEVTSDDIANAQRH